MFYSMEISCAFMFDRNYSSLPYSISVSSRALFLPNLSLLLSFLLFSQATGFHQGGLNEHESG